MSKMILSFPLHDVIHYCNVVAVANNIRKAETKSEGLTKPILKLVSGNYIYIL